MHDTTDPIMEAAQSLLVSEEPSVSEPDAGDLPSDEAEPDDGTDDAPALDAEADDEPASDDDPDEPASSDDGADLHDYTVNGQVRKATLAELKQKAALADGAHARMQRAGEAEKAAQAAAATFQREFQALQAFHAQARATGFLPPPTPPDPQLAQTHPAAYVKADAEFRVRFGQYQQQQAHFQRAQAAAQQAHRAELESRLTQEAQRLAEFIPEFAKPETAAKAREDLHRYAMEEGYGAEEINALIDARHAKTLWKSWKYDQLMARQRAAKSPTPTPRHVAPAAAKRPEPPQLAHARQVKQAMQANGGRLTTEDAVRSLLVPQPRKR